MATKIKTKRKPTKKPARAPFIPTPAAKPVTMRLVKAIVADASAANAPIPFPIVYPIFLQLIQALFPCLVAPTPASVQAAMSNPTRFQARRMDRELYRGWQKAGSPGSYFAFSHATFGQCRKATVMTWASVMRENPRA